MFLNPFMTVPPLAEEDLQHVLRHTQSLWEDLRGQRLFVTGATGFFGSWLLESFAYANDQLELGAELVGLTRDPEAYRSKVPHLATHRAIRLLRGDIRNFDFPEGHFSHVIHAGATSSLPVPPLEMLDTIIQGTHTTLDFAVAAGVRNFLMVSSGAVYGKQPPEMTHLSETYTGGPDASDPNSAYGEGKRVAELLGAIYAKEHGLQVKTARCFAFVGPHLPLDAHFAIGNFIRDAMRDASIQIKSDGAAMRSYLYAADLAIWLWTILFKAPQASAYNVGSDHELSIKELADIVAFAFGDKSSIKVEHSPSGNRVVSRYVPAIERAQGELNLNVRISLHDALFRTVRWHQKH
jgi:nucleoside-diphosphate-sugar epimerase